MVHRLMPVAITPSSSTGICAAWPVTVGPAFSRGERACSGIQPLRCRQDSRREVVDFADGAWGVPGDERFGDRRQVERGVSVPVVGGKYEITVPRPAHQPRLARQLALDGPELR